MFGFTAAARDVLLDLRSRTGMEIWTIGRRDGDDYVVVAAVSPDDTVPVGTVLAWEQTLSVQMTQGKVPVVAGDVRQVPVYEALLKEYAALWPELVDDAGSPSGGASCLVVPVLDPDETVLGTLSAFSRQVRDDLDDWLPVVQLQARLIGTLLSHELRIVAERRRAERAEQEASTDPLTGAGNRRAWQTALRQEEDRAARYGSSTAVVVIDLDGLKQVNDAQGHAAGDRQLRQLGRVVRRRLRPGDLLSRLGGDEFGLLLPETDITQARRIADHLRRSLAAQGVSVSIGVAARGGGQPVREAWRRADTRMYADKLRRLVGRTASPPAEPTAGVLNALPAHAGEHGSPVVSSTTSLAHLDRVDAVLEVARTRLGMDAAYLSRLDGDTWVIRNAATAPDLPPITGLAAERALSYCQRMVDGRLPHVVRDTRQHDLTRDLPVTEDLGVGAWMGVPVHRLDGTLYGTLCVLARHNDPTMSEHELSVLEVLAPVIAELVDDEDRGVLARHELVGRLDEVFVAGGPFVVFQPVCRLADRAVEGVEALSRFPAPASSPAQWFAEASAAGVGVELEMRALANAVARLDDVDGYLAVNLSQGALLSPGFQRTTAGLPLDRLVVEITEHEVIDSYDTLHAVLQPLRSAGLRLAVDDVGAGFSSLLHVLSLQPDVIKVDVGLVRGIDADVPRRAMVRSIASFGQENESTVVAEGIETDAELSTLRDLGVLHGQGYLLGRPGPLARGAGADDATALR